MFNHLGKEVRRLKREATEQVREYFQMEDVRLRDKERLRREVEKTIRNLFAQENIGYLHIESKYHKAKIRKPGMDNPMGIIFVSVIDKMVFLDEAEGNRELNDREKGLEQLSIEDIGQIARVFSDTGARIEAGFTDISFGYPKTGVAAGP